MAENGEASPSLDSIGGKALDSSSSSSSSFSSSLSFQCFVCLDLLYKPIVLACGHMSCFWCAYKAMHGVRASHCGICRQQYHYFPNICELLHLLLQKIEPVAYKLRAKEVLDENNSCTLDGAESSAENITANRKLILEENKSPENGLRNEVCEEVSVADVQCSGCKELLFQPSVLNCGHVYCQSCMSFLVNGPVKCQICQTLHPRDLPKVCLELDHFLEELFPKEYVARKEKALMMKFHENPSICGSETQKLGIEACHAKDHNSCPNEDFSKAHVGIGCDSCGMYPIIGDRYKCIDCREKAGFDLCESCYNSGFKLRGRFNQRHTPDHRFELDDSRMLCKIFMAMVLQPEEPIEDLPGADPRDPGNIGSGSYAGMRY